ncbi:MAG: vitamin B12-dependent ribonucleotide reductase, partial [Planctomycetota bacterium]
MSVIPSNPDDAASKGSSARKSRKKSSSRRNSRRSKRSSKLRYERVFSRAGTHPFDEIRWEMRSASITSDTGKVIFEQTDVEGPAAWSQLATNVVVSKYFRGAVGQPDRETSVKQL